MNNIIKHNKEKLKMKKKKKKTFVAEVVSCKSLGKL